jgi:hypothetical protein
MNIDGFIPVIINVTPVVNLPLLLGFDMPGEKPIRNYLTNTPDSSEHSKILSEPRVKSSQQGICEITFDSKDFAAPASTINLGFVEQYRNKYIREYHNENINA